MSKQLFIYQNAIPVSSVNHRELCVRPIPGYPYAKSVNALPLMSIEFAKAALDYPIVFAGKPGAIMPLSVMGLRDGENLFVNDLGEMQDSYVPAFLRRYPFVFSSANDGKSFNLCVDEAFEGCNLEGKGERLFDSEGNRTHYLAKVLSFLKDYQAYFQRTQAFCQKLESYELLEPMGAQFQMPENNGLTLTGFQAINREKVKALAAEDLKELAQSDELELIYCHLESMNNFERLLQRLRPRLSNTKSIDQEAENRTKQDQPEVVPEAC